MAGTWSKLVTVVTGQTITASLWNSEFDNVITNSTPAGLDDDSTNLAAMQGTTDPYPASSESLATDLSGELRRLRYVITQLNGEAQWYTDPLISMTSFLARIGKYRRPVLTYGSATTVAVESGLDGTSGNIPILFPDGSLRTETSTTRTTFTITRNAVLVTSGAQSGLTGATAEANNTWYALYACKVTDSSTLWVTVGSTVFPSQANWATLNTAYGTNGWVYLGMIRNGDQGSTAADILNFTMCGNVTRFHNAVTGGNAARAGVGIIMATTASATSLTYTNSFGTAGAVTPTHCTLAMYSHMQSGGASRSVDISDSGGTRFFASQDALTAFSLVLPPLPVGNGLKSANSGGISSQTDILLSGFVDGVLGVGLNPHL